MKKILVLLFLPVMLVTSCVDTLDDYNISQKSAPSGSVPPSMLVSSAIRNFADQLTSPSVNSNNFRLYVQQWATTTYTEEPRYNLTARTIPQAWWATFYRDVLSDLREAKRLITADLLAVPAVKTNQLAQIAIMEAYTWHVLVSTFGDVPYTQALDYTNSLPVYDDAQTIYYDQLTKLDAAIASLITTSGGIVAANDLLYAGSVTQWKKFANSLKLKMAMMIADSDPAKSKTLAEQAIAAGVFTANTDNARINGYTTSTPNNNPVSANTISPFTTRQDFVVGRTIVNKTAGLADPRRSAWFTNVAGAYVGGNTGFANTFASTSKPSSAITIATAETLILDYPEVEFLLAEAAARGYTVVGTAETHYNAGITASMTYWGIPTGTLGVQTGSVFGVKTGGTGYTVGDVLTVTGGVGTAATKLTVATVSAATAATPGAVLTFTVTTAGSYTAVPTPASTTSPGNGVVTVTGGTGTGATFNAVYEGGIVNYLANPDVAYTTASTYETTLSPGNTQAGTVTKVSIAGNFRKVIGEQKYLALNNRGFDAWTEWRRLDAPKLYPVQGGTAPAGLIIPNRLIYPVSEQTQNGTAWAAAAAKYGGATDTTAPKLFWDKL